LSRIHFLRCTKIRQGATEGERDFALDQDLKMLEAYLAAHPEIGLVTIDPISSYLGETEMKDEQGLRRVLIPVKNVCERTGVTIIGAGHFTKKNDVGSAIHRVGGAVAMAGVARAVWSFQKDTTTTEPGAAETYLMLLVKANLTSKRSGLRYRFEKAVVTLREPEAGKEAITTEAPLIRWLGDTTETADSALNAAANPNERLKAQAESFLRKFLTDAPRLADDCYLEATKRGISARTLERAKKALKVKSVKEGVWWWSLPEESTIPPQRPMYPPEYPN
jgi:putative DNA primase/helicase